MRGEGMCNTWMHTAVQALGSLVVSMEVSSAD